jgi:hypothetical protein
MILALQRRLQRRKLMHCPDLGQRRFLGLRGSTVR